MPTIATRQAAKFWVSLVGLILTTVAATNDVPGYVTAAAAVCTAVAVYLVPNAVPADGESGDL